jgi:uncharacterized protein (TIGR03086 family)
MLCQDEQISAILASLEAARSGQPRLLSVPGKSGRGKTSLLRVIAIRASGFNVLEADGQESVYRAPSDLLRHLGARQRLLRRHLLSLCCAPGWRRWTSGHDGAVPIEGDLIPVADRIVERALAMWGTDGVLAAAHATSFGEMPGSVVANFPTIDAIMHAWDLSASVGHPIEFRPDAIPAISAVMEATCTDEARAAGLIRPPTKPPADSSATERLVAAAGRGTRL